jgi:hypothetical protein
MNQIIATNMKKYIKEQITENGCNFTCKIENEQYCHFLVSPECGFYGEMHTLDLPKRQEFYRCRLPEQLKFKGW